MTKALVFIVMLFVSITISNAQTAQWLKKVPGGGLGNPFIANPLNDNIIYSAPGNNQIWISRDRGNNWSLFSTVAGGNQLSTIVVNPLDTNVFVVAQQGGDYIKKSTDHGQTWITTGTFNFSYFGVPLEWEKNYPELLYTMNGTNFLRSQDFGSTWEVRSVIPSGQFNEMCDMEIRPDRSDEILLGDNGYGIWKSIDAGASWSQKFNATSGEVPMIAYDRTDNNIVYATRFSGGGGMLKSTDAGESWNYINSTVFSGTNTWGVTTSAANPEYVYMGTYGGADPVRGIWMSRNRGETWTRLATLGLGSFSNDGIIALDTNSVLVLQGDGIYKYRPQNISAKNVRATFSVNLEHSLDVHTDIVLENVSAVFLKGELSALGNNAGNWTYADTANGAFVRLFDDGSHGDSVANDKVWSRQIIIPAGTAKGIFHYKYGAAYSGIDTVNGGVAYLNNESNENSDHTQNFNDIDTIVQYTTDKWLTRGSSQSKTVHFSVNVQGGGDIYNNVPVSEATNMWIKGNILPLGKDRGSWVFADTLNGTLIKLFNDATHGDSVANDNVWSTEIIFPENTRLGEFSYRYGISYPNVQNANGGIMYLNNEISSGEQPHTAMFVEEIPSVQFPRDEWKNKRSGIIVLSSDSLAVAVPQNQLSSASLTVTNGVEVGGKNLFYHISIEDASFDSAQQIGAFSVTSQFGKEKGNVYQALSNTILKEIRLYGNATTTPNMSFFVYEGTTHDGVYKKIFSILRTEAAGEGWKSSGIIRVNLLSGKYYYIGSTWSATTTFVYGRNSAAGQITMPFGIALHGQTANNLAAYPPKDSVIGSGFNNPNGFFYQELVTNSTPYISLTNATGTLTPQSSNEVTFTIVASTLVQGIHNATITIESNDFTHPQKMIPFVINVLPPVGVSENGVTPKRFSLEQNYPNPFNPTTVINFSLVAARNVTLKIYDIVGREIVTLLDNEKKDAGNYNVQFDASNLPSGIYLYKLTAGDFVSVKKMLLLK
jgi:hypothetical protein